MLLRHLFYNECSCLNNIYHHSEKCKRVCFIDNSCKITYNNRDGGRFMKNKKIILIIIGVVVGIAFLQSLLKMKKSLLKLNLVQVHHKC